MRREMWSPAPQESQPSSQSMKGVITKAYRRLMRAGDEYKKARFKTSQYLYEHNLNLIKKLISQLPDEKDRIVYERNCMRDISHFETICQFCSPSFRFDLHVTLNEECLIHYSFNNCSIKDEIMHIITYHKLSDYYQEKQKDNFLDYYEMVLKDYPKYVYVL